MEDRRGHVRSAPDRPQGQRCQRPAQGERMSAMTVLLLLGALFMGLAGGLVFMVALKSGQFEDEDVKYQMFREED
ncbi:MAG: cbb3-type cytochrome oxidase assembly protein CcoS [Zetaproteobacteria bacterium CG23_combo_of_CG06-09_8_20_14_all_54_7]|nr:MAG: cbb3-type cytochrome oxidase assembly protein CcoS [Zetaproteobacteria bacterium CG23_combo_of_CG06-09_8_20_14_all_54_7]